MDEIQSLRHEAWDEWGIWDNKHYKFAQKM